MVMPHWPPRAQQEASWKWKAQGKAATTYAWANCLLEKNYFTISPFMVLSFNRAVIVVLTICLCLVKPRVAISITPSPTVIGGPVTINCTAIQGYPQPRVSMLTKCRCKPNCRCQVSTTNRSVVYTTKLAPDRVGVKYRCSGDNKAGSHKDVDYVNGKTIYSRYFVFVFQRFPSLVKPIVHLTVSNSAVEAEDTVTVTCRGDGYPRPSMSLSMPNGSTYNFVWKTGFNSSIRIGTFAMEGGVYNCSATNVFGTARDDRSIQGVYHLDEFLNATHLIRVYC